MAQCSVPSQEEYVEIKRGKDLIKRDRRSMRQQIEISWADELLRIVLSKESINDDISYYVVRTFYSDRVASLAEANPYHDVLDCQLYDMLILREDKANRRYKWFDTEGDSTIEFLQNLAEKYASPEIYKESKRKFARIFGKL